MTISKETLTLPGMLKKCRYTTGISGKWHLGLGDGNLDFNKLIKHSPNDVGFDYSFIYPATNDRVPSVYIENGQVVGFIDLFASFANLLKFDLPNGQAPDSRDAQSVLLGRSKQTRHNEVVIHENRGCLAIRLGDWKLIPGESRPGCGKDELYNLRNDHSEQFNVAGSHPKIVKMLYDRLTFIKTSKQ